MIKRRRHVDLTRSSACVLETGSEAFHFARTILVEEVGAGLETRDGLSVAKPAHAYSVFRMRYVDLVRMMDPFCSSSWSI